MKPAGGPNLFDVTLVFGLALYLMADSRLSARFAGFAGIAALVTLGVLLAPASLGAIRRFAAGNRSSSEASEAHGTAGADDELPTPAPTDRH